MGDSSDADGVPQCLVGNAMEKAKVPEEEQQQIRDAFTARSQIEVSTARNLIKKYAPLGRDRRKRTRAWKKNPGLLTIYRCLGEYENELVKTRYVMQPARAAPVAPQPKRARRESAKRPRAPAPPQCPICLEDLDDAPALACGHQFHAACVQELAAAASRRRTRGRGTAVLCPLCRAQSYVQ